jgi:hypothetical protein
VKAHPYPVNRAGVLERFEGEKFIELRERCWSISRLGAILFAKQSATGIHPICPAPHTTRTQGFRKTTTRMMRMMVSGRSFRSKVYGKQTVKSVCELGHCDGNIFAIG